jgi:hypothetical protein
MKRREQIGPSHATREAADAARRELPYADECWVTYHRDRWYIAREREVHPDDAAMMDMEAEADREQSAREDRERHEMDLEVERRARETVDYRNIYGARETNGLADGHAYHASFNETQTVDWTEPGLRITRLRLLSDPGFPMWDVSYCHGSLRGADVRVRLPFHQLPKRGIGRAIVDYAIRDGINAKRTGIFDCISTLI